MLQELLEKRFGLVVHRVSYESPVYFLIPGKKVNLTETKEGDAADIHLSSAQHFKRVRPISTGSFAWAGMYQRPIWQLGCSASIARYSPFISP
jgi:uncharacterized protein (TIGR03435 family)